MMVTAVLMCSSGICSRRNDLQGLPEKMFGIMYRLKSSRWRKVAMSTHSEDQGKFKSCSEGQLGHQTFAKLRT